MSAPRNASNSSPKGASHGLSHGRACTFYAIATHPKIYGPPSTPEQAIAQIEAWLAAPTISVLGESVGYWDDLKPLLAKAKVAGPMAHDARIAALCLAHGVHELWSADRDFGRFNDLRVHNRLID